MTGGWPELPCAATGGRPSGGAPTDAATSTAINDVFRLKSIGPLLVVSWFNCGGRSLATRSEQTVRVARGFPGSRTAHVMVPQALIALLCAPRRLRGR